MNINSVATSGASQDDTSPSATRSLLLQNNYQRSLFLIFLLSLPLVNPIVHGDGVSYYAYVRAPLIQHNLSFEEDWRHGNSNFSQGRVRPDGQLLAEEYTSTGHVDNYVAVGPALLWSVFLIPTHLTVLAFDALGGHVPADGFSFPYILAMAMGTAVYGFLGLLLGFSLASKYMGEKWAFLATVGIWFGSSLPVYMYFNPAWSHAPSAFAVALFLWYWERTRAGRTSRQWVLLGLISGLMIDVYFPNGAFLVVLLVESFARYSKWRTTRISAAYTLVVQNLLFLLGIFLAAIPTFATRKAIFGSFLNFGRYPHLAWDWSAPHWASVLFSADHGLISWTPLLGLALLGLLFPARHARNLAICFAAAFFAFYYLISSYPYWDGLSSFGNRFFISVTPIFVFGLAMLLAFIARQFCFSRPVFILSSVVLCCFVLWNAGFIFQWGTHLIPVRGSISWSEMTYNQVVVVPREISGELKKFFFRRKDLMRQIEKRDLEQMNNGREPEP
jgi:hypothetical protein